MSPQVGAGLVGAVVGLDQIQAGLGLGLAGLARLLDSRNPVVRPRRPRPAGAPLLR